MILRVAGQDVERRAFALTDMLRYGYDGLRNVGAPTATQATVAGIPAIHRAARMRSEAVASLRLQVCRGYGVDREVLDGYDGRRPWQAQLFAQARMNETQTSFTFWETVEESLAYRGNAYIWRSPDPSTGRVVEMSALHPDQVQCQGANQYKVTVGGLYLDPVGRGPATYIVGSEAILHIRGHGDGGKPEAPSPIKVFRDALLGPLGRMRHENRMWNRGLALQLAVAFPPGVTPAQAEVWREQWRASYEGTDGGTTAVVGGGAQLTPIGMTLADAQFVDMAKLTAHDAARIMGVPANLLEAQLDRSVPNLEQDLAMWLRFGLGPELARIEAALAADGYLFPDGTDIYPMFETDEFVRGDLMTEANVMHLQIQDGTLTPDEGRAKLGLPPHPAGMGATPQVTPVGGAPNAMPMIPKVPPVPAQK